MRVINFNAGPAAIPLPALQKARDELLEFRGSGMSVMEHSHRGAVYEKVHAGVKERLTRLLSIPDTHTVLFLTGGASMQFGLVPLNFLTPGSSADYVLTGVWSDKAIDEAKLVGPVRVAASTRGPDGRYTRVPAQAELDVDPRAAYLHTTSNNTIYGTQFRTLLDSGEVPHVCDMSSDFLSRPVDVSRFALIYAGAQKNVGASGVVIAIARKDFLARGRTDIPRIFRYATHADNDSMYNTPPTFSIYLAGNVLEWIEAHGGLSAIEARNQAKADLLYRTLDGLRGFYTAPVEPMSRSVMNIVFRCPSEDLDARLVKEAATEGMVGLKGHRSAGGIRASTYNAVSIEDAQALASFLKSFAQSNG